jgi:hypothetical protein
MPWSYLAITHTLTLYITKRERLKCHNKLLHGVERTQSTKHEPRFRATRTRDPAHRHISRKCFKAPRQKKSFEYSQRGRWSNDWSIWQPFHFIPSHCDILKFILIKAFHEFSLTECKRLGVTFFSIFVVLLVLADSAYWIPYMPHSRQDLLNIPVSVKVLFWGMSSLLPLVCSNRGSNSTRKT